MKTDDLLDDVIAQRDELLSALKSLRNEASWLVGLREIDLRALVGNTNVACLINRLSEAAAAIAKAERK